jgi:hypothetical protein
MVMVPFALYDRNHTAMGHFANYVFELNGRVVDAEIVQQTFLHVAQNALTD